MLNKTKRIKKIAPRKEETEIKENSKDVACKHLAKFAGFYIVVMVVFFIFASLSLPAEKIAVVAGLITMVVTGLLTILKGITDTNDKDPMISIVRDLINKVDKEDEEFQVTIDDKTIHIHKGTNEKISMDRQQNDTNN